MFIAAPSVSIIRRKVRSGITLKSAWPFLCFDDMHSRHLEQSTLCLTTLLHRTRQSLLDLLHRTSATLPTSNSPKAMRTQSRLSEQDDCLSISHIGGHSRRCWVV